MSHTHELKDIYKIILPCYQNTNNSWLGKYFKNRYLFGTFYIIHYSDIWKIINFGSDLYCTMLIKVVLSLGIFIGVLKLKG